MTRRRRCLIVAALLLIAPWMAEVAWGGLPVADVALIVVFLSPLYGAAALLIREWARHTGRGWPSMLLMGAAFGLLQCGLVDQSLFNPSYGRYDFQHPLHVPGLHFSLLYLVSFVSGHAMLSIGVPIALVEGAAKEKGPWVGRIGIGVAAVALVGASVLNFLDLRATEHFQAAPVQSVAAGAGVVALAVAAHLVRPVERASVRVPPLWSMVLLGAVGYQVFTMLVTLTALGLAGALALLVVAWIVLRRWSAHADWSSAHVLALAVGVALVNVVAAFPTEPYLATSERAELVNDLITSGVTLAIAVGAVLVARRRGQGAPTRPSYVRS